MHEHISKKLIWVFQKLPFGLIYMCANEYIYFTCFGKYCACYNIYSQFSLYCAFSTWINGNLSKYLWTLYIIKRGRFYNTSEQANLYLQNLYIFFIRCFSAVNCCHNFRSIFSLHKWFGGFPFPLGITRRLS